MILKTAMILPLSANDLFSQPLFRSFKIHKEAVRFPAVVKPAHNPAGVVDSGYIRSLAVARRKQFQ